MQNLFLNNMSIESQIETLLFLSTKPLSLRKLAKLTGADSSSTEEALSALILEYNRKRGIAVVKNNNEYQMVSAPENASLAKLFYEDEFTGELTKPALETLTIISYQGPLTKPELEEIRGINCSLILRNLMIRGLIKKEHDSAKGMDAYAITIDFMRWLGINNAEELPEYERLSRDLRQTQDVPLPPAV